MLVQIHYQQQVTHSAHPPEFLVLEAMAELAELADLVDLVEMETRYVTGDHQALLAMRDVRAILEIPGQEMLQGKFSNKTRIFRPS
jgi:hypothetical protein